MFKNSKPWERTFQKPPLVPTARTGDDCGQTWRRSGTNGYAAFGIFETLTNPCYRKQDATLANFILCYQKIFVTKKFRHWHSCRYLQIVRELFA